jgi:S-adenosylmethionine:tRNA ribosyltransferase-isomerase
LRLFMDEISISDYTYELPPERIASDPLAKRDQSKLLVYQGGKIVHSKFDQLTRFLPGNSTLFFNDTKVIPARIIFTKDTGASIELFLLNPHWPHLVHEAMQATGSVQWHCAIGNLKRWTSASGDLIKESGDKVLRAKLIDRDAGLVEFSWSSQITFAEILNNTGDTPLPPYIKRTATSADRERYQTVYSHLSGAVAAPTAGLHFTADILSELTRAGHLCDFLTLHVSAGTFQPVKTSNAVDHPMHTEQILVTLKNLDHLLMPDRKIVAVGTTSLRTLESLYWYGVKLLENPEAEFSILKLDPYSNGKKVPAPAEAFSAVRELMYQKNLTSLSGETSILILPGYLFKSCQALITNFHQPGSTLMLLVAAFVGPDWRRIYAEALSGDYRFLSYGDSSLLVPPFKT